ncbi:MAG: DUF1294 domain-containing protein [Acidobacteriota bacterium]
MLSEVTAIGLLYGVASGLALVLYAVDKSAARRGGRRTPERVLHACSLLGGWPGALLAQSAFRHKTRKQPFRSIFWLTVCLNVALLSAFVAIRTVG